MEIRVFDSTGEMGKEASSRGVDAIRRAIEQNGRANIILATGASQFQVLETLVQSDIEWAKLHCFHLDEYVGLTIDHPAGFCKYLKERFVDKVLPLGSFHYIRPDLRPPEEECRRLNGLISDVSIDVAFIGIGENAHLAFNDPPADFETEVPFMVVELDEGCRRQQLGEGWFKTLDEVPRTAVSMSIRQILKSERLIVTVPNERKAKAVQCAVEGPVSPECPASILQQHADCTLFLDSDSASLLQDAGQ